MANLAYYPWELETGIAAAASPYILAEKQAISLDGQPKYAVAILAEYHAGFHCPIQHRNK